MKHNLLVPVSSLMILKRKKQHATYHKLSIQLCYKLKGRKKQTNLQEHSYYFNSKKQAVLLQNDEVNYRITDLNTAYA